ncbi:nucleotidyltransferase domain-containing protein [Mucilaginibacter paludis]|uniref:Polymerase nucleotidyl transferase domain-containing protein n=1 Tax=Mucilaginibacter paludis DSM 18603 TaxID=714943 RepID=H1YGA2_9SPHI|nr:nucleotidyltransferase domain-containing protein [Mucilaginibacter paludis]EHQ27366.1 hypothetical protein Mucpa_3262 [Mucilaginibacter paludis DSM 18603]
MKNYQLKHQNLPSINKNIIAALAYFDVFNYPLTQAEIFLFLGEKCDHNLFTDGLAYLLAHNCIYCFDTFYTLRDDPQIAIRRRNGNLKANQMMPVAAKVCKLLIRFPFVRGIAISGSLSKNFADEQSDIDLFIITAPNRLWLARTLMHLFKKLTFLVNKEHFFCMNYFIDEQELEIVEKNIYTATEIVTLIPLEGDIAFEHFYSANAWTMAYLPNNYMRVSTANPLKKSFIKTLAETILDHRVGDALDSLLCKITGARWLKKTQRKKLNAKGLIMGMKASKHYAKPDPGNFQQNLVKRYQNKVQQLLKEHQDSMAQV